MKLPNLEKYNDRFKNFALKAESDPTWINSINKRFEQKQEYQEMNKQ
jgi:hypothetical protein